MEWFEDESLWRELYPYVFPVERVAAAPGQVTQLLSLAGVTGGAELDLCCGPGRHAVEFARRGQPRHKPGSGNSGGADSIVTEGSLRIQIPHRRTLVARVQLVGGGNKNEKGRSCQPYALPQVERARGIAAGHHPPDVSKHNDGSIGRTTAELGARSEHSACGCDADRWGLGFH